MSPSRVVFFGTPEFALPTLQALAASAHEVALVVTQPARPAGRGRGLQQPPVARWAEQHGLPVEQPEKVRSPKFLARLRGVEPEVAVVVAFGQIFPAELLALPRLGCLNLHASLLPAYRGAAPIQAAIAAGDRATGVTTMRMEEGLDSGPILLQRRLEIGAEETAGELAPRLARLGAELVLETLARLERGELEERPQDDAAATYAPRLRKTDGRIDWSLPAGPIFDRLRAFTPWPGAFTELRGDRVKVLAARPADATATPPGLAVEEAARPGTFLGLAGGRLLVRAGGGTLLAVERLQRAGRKPVAAPEFVNGERLAVGERFG